MNGRLLQKVVSGGGGRHLPEGLMGGVRGEQEVGVNQKTVKGQKTEVRASGEPRTRKGADRWRLPPSGTTTLCGLTPPSGSRKASQSSPLGPPAAVVGPEVHPQKNRVPLVWVAMDSRVVSWYPPGKVTPAL